MLVDISLPDPGKADEHSEIVAVGKGGVAVSEEALGQIRELRRSFPCGIDGYPPPSILHP
jgi:hypothetical protein